MPAIVNQQTRKGWTLFVLLVFAAAAVTGVAGFHAHETDSFESDAAASGANVCGVCALSHAPAVPSLAHTGVATVETVARPLAVDADTPRPLLIERPHHGRAPPAC